MCSGGPDEQRVACCQREPRRLHPLVGKLRGPPNNSLKPWTITPAQDAGPTARPSALESHPRPRRPANDTPQRTRGLRQDPGKDIRGESRPDRGTCGGLRRGLRQDPGKDTRDESRPDRRTCGGLRRPAADPAGWAFGGAGSACRPSRESWSRCPLPAGSIPLPAWDLVVTCPRFLYQDL
jgi:hypothetical protein